MDLPGQSLLTPEELLALAQPLLSKELVQEIGAIFKFVVTGEGGGTYYLDLKTGDHEFYYIDLATCSTPVRNYHYPTHKLWDWEGLVSW